MISTRIFVLGLVACAAISSGLTYLFAIPEGSSIKKEKVVVAQKAVTSPCPVEILRLSHHSANELTSPILLTDIACNSEEYDSLRNDLTGYIAQMKKSGVLQQASVYLKAMSSGKWFDINGTAMYNPGSMMKVAILMAYLKDAESDATLLSKQYVLKTKMTDVVDQIRTSPLLEVGKSYSVKYLLEEMIVNSDNDATNLLNENLNQRTFTQVMGDLGSRTPSISDPNFEMSVLEYNRYLRVLYNSSYLNETNSQYALELLSRSNYRGALIKNLPSSVKVAHKFGERPYEYGFNFHEGGIVYASKEPYTLVVMTRGKDHAKLPDVIAEISKRCFEFMN